MQHLLVVLVVMAWTAHHTPLAAAAVVVVVVVVVPQDTTAQLPAAAVAAAQLGLAAVGTVWLRLPWCCGLPLLCQQHLTQMGREVRGAGRVGSEGMRARMLL